MPDARKAYVDSCVYLAYVNNESAKMPDIDAVFAEAGRKEIELWTSVVTISEVAFAKLEQDGKLPDEATMVRIDALWLPPAPTKLIEFYEAIARDARDVVRLALPDGRKPLKPMDAIHVATAKRWGIETIYTYDDGMIEWAPDLGMTIMYPRPEKPEFPWVNLGAIEPGPPA